MLRKLKLYGELAEFVGQKEFEIKFHNVSSEEHKISHNFGNFEQYPNDKNFFGKPICLT